MEFFLRKKSRGYRKTNIYRYIIIIIIIIIIFFFQIMKLINFISA